MSLEMIIDNLVDEARLKAEDARLKGLEDKALETILELIKVANE